MPCWTVVMTEVEFKIENLDLLKKAVEKAGYAISGTSNMQKDISLFQSSTGKRININLATGKMSSAHYNEKELIKISHSLKRTYSEQVIDEVAKKQKWFKKKLGDNQYQLQRF